LRERGVETVFLLPDGDDEFERMATEEGFDVRRPGLARMHPPTNVTANAAYLLTLPASVRRIRRVIEEEDIDVVHANMPVNFQTGLGASWSSAALIWHFNDTSMPWLLARIAARTASRLADEIVVAADAVDRYYFSESDVSTTTLYAPVDVREFDSNRVEPNPESLRDEFDVDLDRPVIGAVGNLNPVKGYEYLLKATRHVIDDYGPVTVLVAGHPPDTRSGYVQRLRELRSDLGLEDSVHFLGRRSDVPQLMALFGVFVLPSVAEACPAAVLEAMAMERAVVATDVGGVTEQITDGEHGWVVPPADPSTLGKAICDALESPDARRRYGERARRRAREIFSLERCADTHERVYRTALSDHGDR
jgi:glycosyltransferase involved in cell wall biosynthesis